MTKRGLAIDMCLNPSPLPETDDDRFWDNLCSWISMGQVIPIISGSLFYDLIFNADSVGCENRPENEPLPKSTVENTIAEHWARRLNYRLPDKQELPRVAQYMRSKNSAPIAAKDEYLRFLKQLLLNFAMQNDPARSPDEIKQLFDEMNAYSFSDLAVRELGLLKFGPGCSDPLSILASLPLPIYITTSYHDVLELALRSIGKSPLTQVCFWSGEIAPLRPEHEPVKKLEASPQRPLVYHLFGLERYPLSMVITEDDYLDFLVQVTLDRRGARPSIPYYLRAPLMTSSLMLLGYRLQDWDFRTLFRGLINTHENRTAAYLNTIIQLSMESQYNHPESDEMHRFFANVQGYLQNYFKTLSFEIRWSDPGCFLTDLYREWERRWR